MTREEAKKMLPFIQAFAEGKVIECRTKPSALSKSWQDMNEWTEMKEIEYWNNTEYRIKPEVKFRPFCQRKRVLGGNDEASAVRLDKVQRRIF